jgi:catechol 2,3-dioxygenase-like lactoylglutathione lyase family enzyme
MANSIAALALVVRDYDEAIAFFTGTLGFTLLEDTPLGGGKRWVRVAPAGSSAPALLLARAATPEQESRVGNQTGGRVFLFLETDDFWRDYRAFKARGVCFVEEPRRETYGQVVVFLDLYGNKWDLVERLGEPADATEPGSGLKD